MHIPESVWLILDVATISGCVAWHQRAPSRHLLLMIAGLALLAALNLPALFAEVFGIESLSVHTDRLFEDQPYHPNLAHWDHSGERLIFMCSVFSWIGIAMFALGWWRQVHFLQPAHSNDTPP